MALPTGITLQGKYRLEKKLGKGGFGLTYRAVHEILNAPFVLKVPNDDLQADPEYPKFVERFLKEGKILWNLSQERHSHIVRITDLFEERGLPWLVMDYIQGESLFDRVQRKGALPEGEVVSFIQQIGGALGVVHGVKLVHRDAHPGNIMILPPNPKKAQREAMLIDFGIAGEMFPSTVSSKFFGNPAFAPYEQFGSPAHPKMDVYTLAASCYFALTGILPESAMNRKLYDRKLLPPKHHRSSLSQQLNDVVMWGMTLEAAQRPTLEQWLNRLAGRPMQFSPHRGRLDHWIKQVVQPIMTAPTVDARDFLRPQQPIPPQPRQLTHCFNLTNKGKKLEFIAVPGGTLVMEGGHRVNLKPFLIGKYPITQQQYQVVMGQNPSSFKSNLDCPVECVRWHDAINFCKKLSRILKQNIDLPSETQWEWAARGAMESKGYIYAGSHNLDEVGWYSKNSGGKPHPVGQKQPNELGVYDMSGNIWEWCKDNWTEDTGVLPIDGTALTQGGNSLYRALRGGSSSNLPSNCTSAYRNFSNLDNRYNYRGFRVVLS